MFRLAASRQQRNVGMDKMSCKADLVYIPVKTNNTSTTCFIDTFASVHFNGLDGDRHFTKFHLTPELGVHSLVWDEAFKLAGQDPDFHRKDLWEAIENGAYLKWKFGIQTIPESKEHDFEFDVLDATKVWPEDLIPVR
ncbi:catalase-like domain-containing protein [Xylaria curta]|nr:catalase-like domain-containing protein [Xylaria curta]